MTASTRTIGRTWGDGVNRKAAKHLVHDISFRDPQRVSCTCSPDVFLSPRDGLSLEDVWDVHRGKATLVAERALTRVDPSVYASDEEVSIFLTLVKDPAFAFTDEEVPA